MASKDKLPIVTLRNAQILPGRWRNFGGEARFNEEGKRSFNLKLDEETATAMQRDGFNIKPLRALDEDDENDGYRVEVAVSYANRPPQVWLISGGQRTLLDEGAINILDYADIERASIAINPYAWETATGSGIKAYLHKAIIYLREDDLDAEMRDIPIAGAAHQDDVRFDD
ncbi:hypothetical protein PBI_CAMILLE_52 [Microbacterium phage Camille]|nr:hypothetical protein PBI_CAMILLE_52 [Microbacterium phage Camille]